jgi:hypothetical protein
MSITQYDQKPDKSRCDMCGRFMSKAQLLKQCKFDGMDIFRVMVCAKCKLDEAIRGH